MAQKFKNSDDVLIAISSVRKKLLDLCEDVQTVEKQFNLPTHGVDMIFAAFNAIDDAQSEIAQTI